MKSRGNSENFKASSQKEIVKLSSKKIYKTDQFKWRKRKEREDLA